MRVLSTMKLWHRTHNASVRTFKPKRIRLLVEELESRLTPTGGTGTALSGFSAGNTIMSPVTATAT